MPPFVRTRVRGRLRVVDSNLTRRNWQLWMNGPGGPVFLWRERTMRLALSTAQLRAPVNNPLNALHRNRGVGRFKAGLRSARTGGIRVGLGFRVSANAPHSVFVEDGRSASTRWQRFSWTRVPKIRWYGRTRRRRGTKVVYRSVLSAVLSTTRVG